MKICSKCKIEKEESEFYKHTRDGLQYRCKDCSRISSAHAVRKMRLGIDEQIYDLLYQKQNGRCDICGKHRDDLTRSLALDHDHTTGKIRGLLCTNCNLILGKCSDDIGILQAAIKYLVRNLN